MARTAIRKKVATLCAVVLVSSCTSSKVDEQQNLSTQQAARSLIHSVLPIERLEWLGPAPVRVSDYDGVSIRFPVGRPSHGLTVVADVKKFGEGWLKITSRMELARSGSLELFYKSVDQNGATFADPTGTLRCNRTVNKLLECTHFFLLQRGDDKLYFDVKADLSSFTFRGLDIERANAANVSSELTEKFLSIYQLASRRFIRSRDVDWAMLATQSQKWLGNPAGDGLPQAIAVMASHIPSDKHSFVFRKPPSSRLVQSAVRPVMVNVQHGWGYIKVPAMSGALGSPETEVADAVQKITTLVKSGTRRWIIDLRGNYGGDLYPMLGSIAPLIGDGRRGYFLANDGSRAAFGVDSRGAYESKKNDFTNNGVVVRLPNEFEFPPSPDRVFVIIDGSCASACEALAIGLSSLQYVTLIGQPTEGYATSNTVIPIDDQYSLALTVGFEENLANQVVYPKVLPKIYIPKTEDPVSWATGCGANQTSRTDSCK